MKTESTRLVSLIEFSKESARLKTKPHTSVAAHGCFSLFEHQVIGLPGVHLNVDGARGEDEVWLVVDRLHETRAPEVESTLLLPWVDVTQNPNEEPRLREVSSGSDLIGAGTHVPSEGKPSANLPNIPPEAPLSLADYCCEKGVRVEFEAFIEDKWRPWAREEIVRRETIRLYSKLFTLKQQLDGGIVEAQLELLWGIGLAIWNSDGTTITYPLVGRLVELTIDHESSQIQIRPRDVDAALETDWFASAGNPGVVQFENVAREFFRKLTLSFSPFDRGTFEPVLRAAATQLDPKGTYWPDAVPLSDRKPPKPDQTLRVTDTWVLFARPRTSNVVLQDLELLRKRVEDADAYPPAVSALVSEPESMNSEVDLGQFRGVSATYNSDNSAELARARDLYFPMAYNDEQVRIVQMLDKADGVVVQGPPGTGKTHTIANVICHYLAEGKRVLVTSMKEPALAVLEQQLPAQIRPLVISLLSSEQEGMKRFEYSIQKIASEVQSLDRASTAKAISNVVESINALHTRLAGIDYEIRQWVKANLSRVQLDTEEIDPQDAARQIVENAGQFEWIPDALGVTPEFAPQFSDTDIIQLRAARQLLGDDVKFVEDVVPRLSELPDAATLLEIHQDILQLDELRKSVLDGKTAPLSDSGHRTIEQAQLLLGHLEMVKVLRKEVSEAGRSWTDSVRERMRSGRAADIFGMLEELGAQLEEAFDRRKAFIVRPVETPIGMESDQELVAAVTRLSESRKPFGLKGLVGKTKQWKQLSEARIVGKSPNTAADWKHVGDFLCLLNTLHGLGVRWNAVADELKIESVSTENAGGGLAAVEAYRHYRRIKNLVAAERTLSNRATGLFPAWSDIGEVASQPSRLIELEHALRHHVASHRLANVWAKKEQIQRALEGTCGHAAADVRSFMTTTLGNASVSGAAMQTAWSVLTAEIARILSLMPHLQTLREVTARVSASGAPLYAAALRKRKAGTVDHLLPDNWRSAWRLRRLATHLEQLDAQEHLRGLFKSRRDTEADLSRAYRDVVAKRTWLRLAENASPSIRAALQAFLNAVQKIGKGTGKRAIRYRQDARAAASQANSAIPCWIMAHYRVSESLPAELGCFDLVIIDEASQSDLAALPSILRAKKLLIVGDHKQVSPEGIGLDEEKILNLMNRFLGDQVGVFRRQMSPERSIYDLFKVVFAKTTVMLKEHFRSVAPIIEYSKREFYDHELKPLRMPTASERLDPPLIDVLVTDGCRVGDSNLPEVQFIVDEVTAIVSDPAMVGRTIGVVSLLGEHQALAVWEGLTRAISPETIERHHITCGDARTFQGKERDIMFLSMVAASNGKIAPLAGAMYEQRFNVAASRARNRMYLVRSVELEQLSTADRLRRSLLVHFATPFLQDENRLDDLRSLCESGFERDMYDELTSRGYRVTPQVGVGNYRIDIVVEGHNDTRLAVECDGDRYHGPDKWLEDTQRQRVLERAGWVFWRCFASTFIRRRSAVLEDLVSTLNAMRIDPIGAENAPRSLHSERRVVASVSRLCAVPVEHAAHGGNAVSEMSIAVRSTSRE